MTDPKTLLAARFGLTLGGEVCDTVTGRHVGQITDVHINGWSLETGTVTAAGGGTSQLPLLRLRPFTTIAAELRARAADLHARAAALDAQADQLDPDLNDTTRDLP